MRGLCGWFADARVDPVAALRAMTSRQRVDASTVESRSPDGAALAVHGSFQRPTLVEHQGLVIAVAGHPRLVQGTQRTADPFQLAESLRVSGADAVRSLGGNFALAAWDSNRRRGWLAVDRMGIQSLFYAQAGGALVFATSLDGVCAHPSVQRSLSPQGVFDYLYYHVCPGPGTIVQDVARLMPGHLVEFSADGGLRERAYWALQFDEQDAVPLQDRIHEFKSLVAASVSEAAQGARVGAFLSGGTDSSTVNGMLCQVSGSPAQAFSIGFDAAGFDETEYARIAARHFGCVHHEHYVKPADVVDAVPMIATSYDQPFGNASAVPSYLCARYARSLGIERLLAGDGGDELFGGNARYAKQHLLNLYQRVPGRVRSAFLEPLLTSTPFGQWPGLRKLRSYVEQARPDMPQRYESYNLLMHLGIASVLSPDFVASIDRDHPAKLLAKAHAPFREASLINQMLAIDLRFVLADGDLPKVVQTCEFAGVDVAFPLLDERIVDFSLRLPAKMKLHGTHLRWFFKRALADFLPHEVITKKKHGFGLPVGQWLLSHRPLYDLAADSIRQLMPRGIVQPRFVTDLLERRLQEHPGYYGTMVWILMMLSLWLESRKL